MVVEHVSGRTIDRLFDPDMMMLAMSFLTCTVSAVGIERTSKIASLNPHNIVPQTHYLQFVRKDFDGLIDLSQFVAEILFNIGVCIK